MWQQLFDALFLRHEQDTALDYISGYCLALDMTDREGQQEAKDAGKPWAAAKGW